MPMVFVKALEYNVSLICDILIATLTARDFPSGSSADTSCAREHSDLFQRVRIRYAVAYLCRVL